MEEKIKNRIMRYYYNLNIYEEINFSDKILLFSESANNKTVEIYTNLNFAEDEYKILIYINNNLIKEIKFYSMDDFYFYFLKHLSEDYFLRNMSFYTSGQLELEAVVKDNSTKLFRKSESELIFDI